MIDLRIMRQISFGDESIVTQLIESAVVDLEESEAAIKGLNLKDQKSVFNLLHKFKTTCVMLGASEMIAKCQEALDLIGESVPLDFSTDPLSSIMLNIPVLRAALVEYLSGNNPSKSL